MAVANLALRLCLAAVLTIGVAYSSFAANRVALVIGNGEYRHVQALPNPANDSADMANALRAIGFSVTELKNLDRVSFVKALGDFSDQAAGADMAVVYFAGHGMEVDRENYLIPVDATLETDRRLRFEAVGLDDLMSAVEDVKGVRIILIDACRNNPFAASMKVANAKRSIGRGLARVEAETGTLISFASKEGTVASDGQGRNSPFTAGLLAHLNEPGLEITFLMRKVRDSVLAATNNEQEPFISASLSSEAVYLVPPQAGWSTTAPPGPGRAETPDEIVWRQIAASDDANAIHMFLRTYPDSKFKPDATGKLAALERAQLPIDAKVKELTGKFYSRRSDVFLRLLPNNSAMGVANLKEDEELSVLQRVTISNSGNETRWYKLQTAGGQIGFADERSVLSKKTFEDKKYFEQAIVKERDIYARAREENSGRFADHAGVYAPKTCEMIGGSGLMKIVMFLYWFKGDTLHWMHFQTDQVAEAKLTAYKTFKGKDGTARFYRARFTDGSSDIVGFRGNDLILFDAKFPGNGWKASVHKKCGGLYSYEDQSAEGLRRQIADLKSEEEE